MYYEHIVTGTFLKRPNRFLAHVLIDGKETVCHIKNTGRLRELLTPGASLLLEYHPNAEAQGRKTAYSVIGVYKEPAGEKRERLLINMDSQAPNQAAYEWIKNGGLSPLAANVRREVTYHDSRFDLAFTLEDKPAFMEVKGV
ncbi:MAG: DNA/RNA nuclease SfsA, partial [Otoolea sp.]